MGARPQISVPDLAAGGCAMRAPEAPALGFGNSGVARARGCPRVRGACAGRAQVCAGEGQWHAVHSVEAERVGGCRGRAWARSHGGSLEACRGMHTPTLIWRRMWISYTSLLGLHWKHSCSLWTLDFFLCKE